MTPPNRPEEVRRTVTTFIVCVWNKTNGGMESLYRSKHEMVFVFKNGTAPHINSVELGRHGRNRTNVWGYAGVNIFREGRMDELGMYSRRPWLTKLLERRSTKVSVSIWQHGDDLSTDNQRGIVFADPLIFPRQSPQEGGRHGDRKWLSGL